MDIDTSNDSMIATNGTSITSLRYGFSLQKSEALRMAAYLVAMADPGGDTFAAVLEAVLNT